MLFYENYYGKDSERRPTLNYFVDKTYLLDIISAMSFLRREIMKKRTWFISMALTAVFFVVPHLSHPAHFSLTGTSNFSGSGSFTLTQFEWCNFNYDRETSPDVIVDPDAGENVGDPVTIRYCYSASGSTTTPGAPYVAIAGIGDSSSFDVGCLDNLNQPDPHYTPPTNPATLILNPGPGQTTIVSYGPQVLTGNETASVPNQCHTLQAYIGDAFRGDFGVFALLYDTRGYPGGNAGQGVTASIDFTFSADILSSNAPVSVPALNQWGTVILGLLLGAGSLYYLKRRKVVA